MAEDGDRHLIHLAGGPDAASGARAAIDLLTAGLFGEIAREHIRLMVSEMVGNSVRHGGAVTWQDPVELTVLVDGAAMRVECGDPVAGFDVPPMRTGFGLTIIESLSSDWGVRHGDAGSIWFEYARTARAMN